MTIRALIAHLSVEIPTGASVIQLLPAGSFRANDGRPTECDAWHIDDTIAATVVAAVNSRGKPYVIDYEHQTLAKATNGQPAPASGWFTTVEWRPGDGLYAVDVEWTERAAAYIAAREYRFLSPVFTYDKTGAVGQLLHVALTNTPALDELDEVSLAAASRLIADLSAQTGAPPVDSTQEPQMDELLEQLRWLLNLPVGATADDVKAQLQKLIGQLSEGKGTAAASINVGELLAERDERIVALSANQIDPARFVPIDVVDGLRGEIAALTATVNAASTQASNTTVDGLITAALSDGRLHPTMETWARGLGQSNLPALQEYVNKAQPIAALTSRQTGGVTPPTVALSVSAPDATQLAICSAMGITPEAFAAANKPAA
ncbi:Mu-like prophage I protein [Cupriavidus sp. H19C3]|uniref:phage protease n=1 Tax=Cupriavidus sp. H19C3 TaxID=3241603 RepID=UPI003BF8D695